MTITLYSGLAGTNAATCAKILGMKEKSTWKYEQEPQMKPQRCFRDSLNQFHKEGAGFPPAVLDSTNLPDFTGVTGKVLVLNMEYYGPERTAYGETLIKAAMRGLGILQEGSTEAYQIKLGRYLAAVLDKAAKVVPLVGLYGFAPFIGESDVRYGVLMHASVYLPQLYLSNKDSKVESRPFEPHMPTRECIPIVYGLLSDGTPLTVDMWKQVLLQAAAYQANRVIVWGDCTDPKSAEKYKIINTNLRAAATAVGVGLA